MIRCFVVGLRGDQWHEHRDSTFQFFFLFPHKKSNILQLVEEFVPQLCFSWESERRERDYCCDNGAKNSKSMQRVLLCGIGLARDLRAGTWFKIGSPYVRTRVPNLQDCA